MVALLLAVTISSIAPDVTVEAGYGRTIELHKPSFEMARVRAGMSFGYNQVKLSIGPTVDFKSTFPAAVGIQFEVAEYTTSLWAQVGVLKTMKQHALSISAGWMLGGIEVQIFNNKVMVLGKLSIPIIRIIKTFWYIPKDIYKKGKI